jgi:hypothetical protein
VQHFLQVAGKIAHVYVDLCKSNAHGFVLFLKVIR